MPVVNAGFVKRAGVEVTHWCRDMSLFVLMSMCQLLFVLY